MMPVKMPMPVNIPKATAGVFANSAVRGNGILPKGKPINNAPQGTKVMVNNPFQSAINKMSMLAPRKY
jgi:hypothetical protein